MELLGFLLPPILDIINRRVKDSDTRWGITVALCALVGIGLNVLQHNGVYDTTNWMAVASSLATSVVAVFGSAQITYKKLWENSDVREALNLDAKKI